MFVLKNISMMNFSASVFSQFQKRYWWLGILWLVWITPAQASVVMRVAIERGVSQVKVGSSTKAVVRDYITGQILGQIAAMNAFSAQKSATKVVIDRIQANAVWIEPTAGGYIFIGDRWYRGKTLILRMGEGLTAINYVDLEQYLYSVVGAEVYDSWPQDALKAQAVAARTYALYVRTYENNGMYDLGNTDYWQAYRGLETEAPSTRAAVNATAKQVLTYKGQIIESQFQDCSGGHTENVEDVWGNYLPYLRGVEGYDEGVSECQWIKTFTPQELSARISGVGNITSLVPTLTTYGSIKSMLIVGDLGTRQLSGETLRLTLNLKSARFQIKPDASGSLRFEGSGWGHGVGMSQWGAYYLASHGVNYQRILGHYYQKTVLAEMQD